MGKDRAELRRLNEEKLDPQKLDPQWFYRTSWVFYLVMAIVGLLWVGASRGDIPLNLFLDTQGWWIDIALGLGLTLLLLTCWDVGKRYLPAIGELEELLSEIVLILPRSDLLSLALISGFAEELFFRGAMLGSWGVFVSSFLFALLHSGPGRALQTWMVFAFLVSLIFSAIVLYRGNITACVVAHSLLNAIQFHRLSQGGESNPQGPSDPKP